MHKSLQVKLEADAEQSRAAAEQPRSSIIADTASGKRSDGADAEGIINTTESSSITAYSQILHGESDHFDVQSRVT